MLMLNNIKAFLSCCCVSFFHVLDYKGKEITALMKYGVGIKFKKFLF